MFLESNVQIIYIIDINFILFRSIYLVKLEFSLYIHVEVILKHYFYFFLGKLLS